MKRGPKTFAGRFVRVRELSRTACDALVVVLDDDTGRERTLRQITIPDLSQRYQLTQKLREAVARAGQVAHPCLVTPVACGVDRPSDSLWITYDTVLRREDAEKGAFDALGFADKIAALAELADALVVAGASSSVHGTLAPSALHIDEGAPRGLYVIDLDLGPFLREAALAAGVAAPAYTAFAAPEILKSPLATGTRAADVYSVASIARAAVEEARFEIAAPLSQLIADARATSPDARPSMRDLALGLHAFAESLAVRGGRSERALREARRDSTLVVASGDMAAARARDLPAPPRRRKRRERTDGIIVALVALVLAFVLAFIARPGNTDDGRLRVRTEVGGSGGGTPSTGLLFVDDRFRGVVPPEDHREVALPEGVHRVELRADDGGVVARRDVSVAGLTSVRIRVPPTRTDDIPTMIRQARIDRFEELCEGTWSGTLDPGRRPVVVTLARTPDDGACGSVDAGPLGRGPLLRCDFDGESLLIAEVTLRGPRPLALRFVCGRAPEMTFFTPTATATLARVVADGGAPTDAGTP